MIASTVRFSAASTSSAASIKTSALARANAASSLMVNEDGRLCSRSRRQHIRDPTTPSAKAAEPSTKWTSAAARNRDARSLAGF